MFSKFLKRLRSRKSQPRAVLVPPDLSLRDSFASPFPHVSEGGYTLYYELALLQRKRAEKEKQNTTVSSSRTLRGHASSSYSQAQTPGASSSRNTLPPITIPPTKQRQNSRPHHTTKPTRPRRQGLDKIQEASPGRPHRSVRKRKKVKNLRQVMAEQDRHATMMLTDQTDTPGTALSRLGSSSCGHGTVDTPPTTVEDLVDEIGVVVNFKRLDERYVDDASSSCPFDRPESASSYHTARTHFSDSSPTFTVFTHSH